MKKILLLLLVTTFMAAAMQKKFQIASEEVLLERFKENNLITFITQDYFLDKTGVVKKLAGKNITPIDVQYAVQQASKDFIEVLKKDFTPETVKEVTPKLVDVKFKIYCLLLQEYPQHHKLLTIKKFLEQ